MKEHRIAVIPGDGIGGEVIAEGLEVLQRAGEMFSFHSTFTEFPWGSEHYLAHGVMMPANALETLAPFDAIYFGAVGHPRVPDNVTLNGLLLPIRRAFEQYACVRPSRLYPGVATPLVNRAEIDLVVVRENTEGEYAQVGGLVHAGTGDAVAMQTAVFTRMGTERVIRFAFDLARSRRRKLTSVTKSNAQGFSMTFWDGVFTEVAAGYPDVATESLLFDSACMMLIQRPHSFDVLVASNLFGDVLSEVGAAITGSLGLAPSANLNPPRRWPSMFEPVHGSAPDIAGQGVANPTAAILSAAMMLEWLGEHDAASAVREAAIDTLREGRVRTPDLGGAATTSEMGAAVRIRLEAGRVAQKSR